MIRITIKIKMKSVVIKMSFSSELKTELSKISNLKNKDEVYAEFLGYLATSNISRGKKYTKFSTENEYNINRFAKLLNNLQVQDYKIEIIGKVYTILFDTDKLKKTIDYSKICEGENIEEIFNILTTRELKKSYIRGNFLGAGSISNPQSSYHLEIILKNEKYARLTSRILSDFGVEPKILKSMVYFKDGEQISNFLALVEANSSVLKFEQIRVVREMKNNVNRLVNCETANMNKTINASVKQINIIKRLKESGKFNSLPEELKEIAKLREENPDATCEELGNMLQTPIKKSSVSHRFKKIEGYLKEK